MTRTPDEPRRQTSRVPQAARERLLRDSAAAEAVSEHVHPQTGQPVGAPVDDRPAQRAALDDPYAYAIVDRDNRALGIAILMEIRPEMRVIEVGHIVYSLSLQRTPLATEAQYLLACYAFETLGYRRYEWKCHSHNAASRRAALRYGFIFEGILRQQMIAKGRNRDTAMFSMLDGEWPARKRNFERWLAPENFTAQAKQKISLSTMNAPAPVNPVRS